MPITIDGVTVSDPADSTLAGSIETPEATATLEVTRLGAYITGSADLADDVTAAEVFAYDKVTKQLFVKNNVTGFVEIVDIADPTAMTKVDQINIAAIPGFGGMNSIAIANGILAVAIESDAPGQPGWVAFYSTVSQELLNNVEVGVLPDMITFTPDGLKLVVANEGERVFDAEGNELPDPRGSISLVDLSAGIEAASVVTTGFEVLDGQEEALRALGVRIAPGRAASTDIEPEYIALSADGTTAYVTLQEANSVGVFDISGSTLVLTRIQPLGTIDYSLPGNEGDFSDRDGPGNDGAINLHNAPIAGLLMPDAIATFEIAGVTYFITANEGDARSDDSDVDRLSKVALNDAALGGVASDLQDADNAGRLNISLIDGDKDPSVAGLEEIYAFGGRGATMFRVNEDGSITKVDETGGEFSKILAAEAPSLFHSNQTNDASTFDARSDDKGPEPEAVDVAVIGGRTYAFIGLERQGGLMVYDVTDPTDMRFTIYVAPFAQEDNGPEIVHYIPGADSPTGEGLLVVSNEISGSVTTYSVAPVVAEPELFTLQLLHLSDGEAGLLAGETAPILAALVDRFDDEYANTLILSGGDTYIPGPFLNAGADPSLNAVVGATAPGRPDVAIHNAIGVEVSAIGNHEWDLGSNIFADSIRASGAWEGAQFALVTANLDVSADSAIRGLADTSLGGTAGAIAGSEAAAVTGKIAPWVTVTKGGEKIGLLGATTQLLERISSPSGTEVEGFPKAGAPGDGTTETDDMDLLAAELQPIIDEILASGIDKVVLQSHLQQIDNEKLLATKLSGVDIILSAGSNTRLGDADDEAASFPGHAPDFADSYPLVTKGLDGKTVLIVNTDNEYTYLGRFVVGFDANGEIVLDSLDPAINGAYASTQETLEAAYGADIDDAFANGSKGAEVRAITEAVEAVIADKDGTVFGYTNVYLEGERAFVRNQETNLGDISADANAFVAEAALGDAPFVVSLKNGGGIRAQIGAIDVVSGDKIPPIANPDAAKPTGGISQLDVENALRFDNKLIVFDTTPEGLLRILNWGAGLPANSGGFPQIGGVRFSFDPTLPGNEGGMPGTRVRDVALVGEDGTIVPLVDDGVVVDGAPSTISVVTLNFIANGGDGYPVKPNGTNFRYLLEDGTLSAPLDTSLDFTAAANVPENALGEQKAFGDYVDEFFGTPETAYDMADTPIEGDTRIQNLAFREDTVLDMPPAPPIMGDDGDNLIAGTPRDDIIFAGAGDDVVDAGDGDDIVLPGEGDDYVLAGEGDDTIVVEANGAAFRPAGRGGDFYDGGDGIDTLDFSAWTQPVHLTLGNGTTRFASNTIVRVENVTGGEGADALTGNALANVLLGKGGDDRLRGRGGDDTLVGEAGDDDLHGGTGDDGLYGGAGDDVLHGGSGDDTLVGCEGDDLLFGGPGDDILVGGPGNDVLSGGAGSDRLVLTTIGAGFDWITDLDVSHGPGADVIVFQGSLFEGYAPSFDALDGFNLIGGGYLRARAAGETTEIQVDANGGADGFVTVAVVDGTLTDGTLADHVLVGDFIV